MTGRSIDRSGANGMSAEQVLRAAIVKMLFGFSYQDLIGYANGKKIEKGREDGLRQRSMNWIRRT